MGTGKKLFPKLNTIVANSSIQGDLAVRLVKRKPKPIRNQPSKSRGFNQRVEILECQLYKPIYSLREAKRENKLICILDSHGQHKFSNYFTSVTRQLSLRLTQKFQMVATAIAIRLAMYVLGIRKLSTNCKTTTFNSSPAKQITLNFTNRLRR
jgi:hypothetical protein